MFEALWLFCDCMAASDDYQSRRQSWLQHRQASERVFIRLGNARLALGITEAVLAYLVFGRNSISAIWLVVPIVVFIFLAVWQSRVVRQRTLADRALNFYRRGIARLDDKWVGTGSFGERFQDSSHVYADDLDLFGKGSLFELVAETRTAAAEQMLASWLLSPATSAEALDAPRRSPGTARRAGPPGTLQLVGSRCSGGSQHRSARPMGRRAHRSFPVRTSSPAVPCSPASVFYYLSAFFAGQISPSLLIAVIVLDVSIGFYFAPESKDSSRGA